MNPISLVVNTFCFHLSIDAYNKSVNITVKMVVKISIELTSNNRQEIFQFIAIAI